MQCFSVYLHTQKVTIHLKWLKCNKIAAFFLTCLSVSIQRPPGTLSINGLNRDVVRGVSEEVLQLGVVSVSRDCRL